MHVWWNTNGWNVCLHTKICLLGCIGVAQRSFMFKGQVVSQVWSVSFWCLESYFIFAPTKRRKYLLSVHASLKKFCCSSLVLDNNGRRQTKIFTWKVYIFVRKQLSKKAPSNNVDHAIKWCVCVHMIFLLPPLLRGTDPGNEKRPRWRVKGKRGNCALIFQSQSGAEVQFVLLSFPGQNARG